LGEKIKPDSKVGLSLSFCVSDILRGVVQEPEVIQIISATQVEDSKDWDELIADYKKYYWYEDPDRAEAIARRFISEGKIRQPRTEGKEAHNIAEGHWLDADNVTNWEKKQGWK
jgi:hypothetical protein